MRSFQLPQGLDESKIEAEFDNGILSIHIPKAALPQPKKIQIGVNKNRSNGNSSVGNQAQVSNGSQRKAQQKQMAGAGAEASNN
jgi:hypothetical protein